jgi:flagellar motor switch protein FliN
MSTATASPLRLTLDTYLQCWLESISQVLGQIAAVPFQAQVADLGLSPASDSSAPVACFSLGAPLSGEQVLSVSNADGLKLSQLLVGEAVAVEESAASEAGHRHALAESFRQIAGAVAASLAAKLGEKIEVKLIDAASPSWLPSSPLRVQIQLTSPRTSAISLQAHLSPELHAALNSAPATTGGVQAEKAVSHGPHEPNLDFLRDVELGVTLRFGTRQMLLRDVVELIPGSVVELDQEVQEPVELLVGRRVIARGEVVVVDGNYGLRVTEVASPSERIESLRD